jgi:L-lysine 2,3-aminomutase
LDPFLELNTKFWLMSDVNIIKQGANQEWKSLFAQSIRKTEDLLAFLELAAPATQITPEFPIRVPLPYARKMQKRNLSDPLLQQVLFNAEELNMMPGYSPDPVQDLCYAQDGIHLQKYAGRSLIVTTGACAIHCRYCFRRNFPYKEAPRTHNHWQQFLAKLDATNIGPEVILSGGDPFMLDDSLLELICKHFDCLEHVHTLRFHTRLPVVLPERIQTGLLQAMSCFTRKKVVVIHCNHPNELAADTHFALQLLRQQCTLLNQSVLLAGVNDCAHTLALLSHKLLDQGVLPYYLHQLDRCLGTHHFEVDTQKGAQIMGELSTILPGYLVPRWVKEIPGKKSKTILPYYRVDDI